MWPVSYSDTFRLKVSEITGFDPRCRGLVSGIATLTKKNGRPSFAEANARRRAGNTSWDTKTAQRVDCVKLLDRLQANALGEYQTLREAGPGMFRRVGAVIGFDWESLDKTQKAEAVSLLSEMLGRIAMDNAAVKSAEICLRKVLPDLAQIEQKNTTNNLHVVMMPGTSTNAEAWAETARLSVESSRLESPAWAADAAVAVSD